MPIQRKNKHNETLNPGKLRLMSSLSFLFGFSDAFLIYILSSYFQTTTGSDNVSVFYLIAFSFVLVALFYFHRLVRRVGKVNLLLLFLILMILDSVLFILVDTPGIRIALLIAHLALVNLVWTNLDILLESFSVDQQSGRIRGLYLTIMNAGLLLAPFLSTFVLERSGFEGIFLLELVAYSVILIVAILGLRKVPQVFRGKVTSHRMLLKACRNPDILRVYHISFAMEFFYAVMLVYVPLYLLHLGFQWEQLGFIFTVMLVPFVLVQYPLGILADRRFGEKEMLFGALVIVGMFTAILPFVASQSVFVWAMLLFLGRFGIAAIEVLRDSYFYKRIDGNDADTIAFFRTTRPVSNIVAAALGGVVVFLFSLTSVFFLVALVVFGALFSAWRLHDSQVERKLRPAR